jgi:tRNA/rRNA methyltransferase
MAGTNANKPSIEGGPAVVLVNPQLGENIGLAARAMYNCGLTDLRLVSPRDGWPSEKARSAASGADPVLEAARVFDTIEEAIGDLRRLYATTARDRYMVKRIVTPRQAASELRQHMGGGEACGILFGPERMGLVSDHAALADTLITVPLNPRFMSLNLAQAVLLIGYEWFTAGDATAAEIMPTGKSEPATRKQLLAFFDHLEEELDRNGFLRNLEKRPSMIRNIRTMFERAHLTDQEIRTLHGIVTAFAGPRDRVKK